MESSRLVDSSKPKPGMAEISVPYFVPRSKSSSRTGPELEMQQLGGTSNIDIHDDVGDSEEFPGFASQVAALGQWFGNLIPRSNSSYMAIDRHGAAGSSGSAAKPRKVPVKVEPKVFFANERTFLAWLHMSVTLASISVAIVAFAEANRWSQLYGLLLMPCSIAFCVYSLWMYIKRAGMIRRKDPGPYEDLLGPIVLSGMLALSIIVNFLVKMYDYST